MPLVDILGATEFTLNTTDNKVECLALFEGQPTVN
jgi:hypothetical protein